MNRKLLVSVLLSSLLMAGNASAATTFIAGWDFSQYLAPGTPTIDGSTTATQVPSNYSDFDPTFGAGSQSAPWGTMYIDGSNGSTAGGGSIFQPTSDQITLLQALPQSSDPGNVQFDASTVLLAEGQDFYSDSSMLATSAVDAVFGIDLSPDGGFGIADSFSLDFAGLALTGSSTVDIDISTDGTSYTNFTSVALGATEQAYNVDFAGSVLDGSDAAFIRLSFDGGQGLIDNLGVSGINVVPEPGTAMLLGTGLMGLAWRGRRRN